MENSPMIKADAPIMLLIFQDEEIAVLPDRRAFLAQKGQRLYGKYCGTKGTGICAESFAEYHIWRGELVIARDFLVYLSTQIDGLRSSVATMPEVEPQLIMTERLIDRIESLLGEKCEQLEASLTF
jgi:hypothetical protein